MSETPLHYVGDIDLPNSPPGAIRVWNGEKWVNYIMDPMKFMGWQILKVLDNEDLKDDERCSKIREICRNPLLNDVSKGI